MKKTIYSLIFILIIAGFFFFFSPGLFSPEGISPPVPDTVTEAFRNKQSNLQVTGKGVVSRILRDDLKGSRHQRFVLTLESGQTVLVAHNIDLAPRIDSLAKGDAVIFFGEYEWNKKGGVVHWTHKDLRGRHPAGWLKHKGILYQ